MPGLRWFALALLLICALASAGNPQIEQAQAEKDAAFARYTRLVTEGGEGDPQAALADYRAAKARLEALQAQAAEAAPAAAAPAATAPADPASERAAVLAALGGFLDAQARGDAAAARAHLALAHLAPAQRAQVERVLTRVVARMRLSDLQWRALAVGVSGELALVRYQYRLTQVVGDERLPQAGGMVAFLLREGSQWKLLQVVVDEALTQATFDSVQAPLALRPRSGHQSLACAAQGPSPGLVDPVEYWEALDACIEQWHVDAGKLKRDAVFSLVGSVPLAGDLVSSSYTLYERLKGVLVELPADIAEGHTDVVLLDLTLVGCGGLQILTELIPGADSQTDALEAAVDHARFATQQRHRYLELMRQVRAENFLGLKKYLFQRFPSREAFERARRELHYRTAADWHGRWPALRGIDLLAEGFMREQAEWLFEVGAELVIEKERQQKGYAAAMDLGLRGDDKVAYVPLRLTAHARGDASRGDPLLGPLDLKAWPGYLMFKLGCAPGERLLSVRLADGSATEDVRVRNLPYNLIASVGLQGWPSGAEGRLEVGQTVAGLRLQVAMQPSDTGGQVQAPALLDSPCVHRGLLDRAVLAVDSDGEGPDLSLKLTGLAAGESALVFRFDATRSAPERDLSIPIAVTDPAAGSVDLDGDWSLQLTLSGTTRRRTGTPLTEAERRAARDSLGLTTATSPPLGASATLRVRIAGKLLHVWNEDESRWDLLASVDPQSAGGRASLLLEAGDADGLALTGKLDGNAAGLRGVLTVKDGADSDTYRAQLSR